MTAGVDAVVGLGRPLQGERGADGDGQGYVAGGGGVFGGRLTVAPP